LKKPHGVQGGSSEANRFAVVILEVLGGSRSPAEAAETLGITPPRYYQLEARALEGFIAALEPRPRVRQPSATSRIAELEKALSQSQRECLRQQALVRAAQRSLGIRGATAGDGKTSGKNAAGRKRRRPAVRALKAAKALAPDTRHLPVEAVQPRDRDVGPAVAAPEGEGAPLKDIPASSKGAES